MFAEETLAMKIPILMVIVMIVSLDEFASLLAKICHTSCLWQTSLAVCDPSEGYWIAAVLMHAWHTVVHDVA